MDVKVMSMLGEESKKSKETKRVIRIHPYSVIPKMAGKTPTMFKRLYKICDICSNNSTCDYTIEGIVKRLLEIIGMEVSKDEFGYCDDPDYELMHMPEAKYEAEKIFEQMMEQMDNFKSIVYRCYYLYPNPDINAEDIATYICDADDPRYADAVKDVETTIKNAPRDLAGNIDECTKQRLYNWSKEFELCM